jgi:hypothetical protein
VETELEILTLCNSYFTNSIIWNERLIYGSQNKLIKIWDVRMKKEAFTLKNDGSLHFLQIK